MLDTLLGELTVLPRSPNWIGGFWRRIGRVSREGKREKTKGSIEAREHATRGKRLEGKKRKREQEMRED